MLSRCAVVEKVISRQSPVGKLTAYCLLPTANFKVNRSVNRGKCKLPTVFFLQTIQ